MRAKARSAVTVLSAVAHAVLLALLLVFAAPPEGPTGEPGAMIVSLYDGEDFFPSPPKPPTPKAVPVQPPPPMIEAPPIERLLPEIEPIFIATAPADLEFVAEPDPLQAVADHVAAAAAAQPGEPGKPCPLADWISAALGAEPGVEAGLATVPRQSRSVAGAIMLWDGAWVRPALPAAEAGLQPVRAAIAAGVEAAPPHCRNQVMRGPLLIAMVGERDTTLLAVGSGLWRWEDMLVSQAEAAAAAGPPGPVDRALDYFSRRAASFQRSAP